MSEFFVRIPEREEEMHDVSAKLERLCAVDMRPRGSEVAYLICKEFDRVFQAAIDQAQTAEPIK